MSLAARSALGLAVLACVAAGAVVAVVMERYGVVVGLALPVAAAVAIAVFRRPVLGAQLALLAIPLEFFAINVGGEAGLTTAEVLLLLTAAAALVRWSVTAERIVVPRPMWALAALCVLIALGYLVAEDSLILTKILLMWSAFVIVGVAVANAEERDLSRLMTCLAVAGGIAGFVAAAGGADQSLVAGGLIATNRAQAGFAQPNVLGFFLVMAIPAAVVLSVRRRGVGRVLMAIMAAGAIWGLMLTLSRTSLVGTAVGLATLLLWPAFRRLALVGIAAIAVFALFNAEALERSQQLAVVSQRLATLGRADVVSSDPRFEIYTTTPSIVAESPVLGVGAGNYSVAAKRYGVLDHDDLPFDHAHNVPLTIAAELGIPGLLVLGWFLILLAGLVMRAIAARDDPGVGPLLLAAAAAMTGTVVTSLGDYPPRTNAIAATFIVLVGVLAGLLRSNRAAP